MSDDKRDRRGMFGWALAASLLFHVLLVAVLIVGPPILPFPPVTEQVITLELVPPPPSPGKAEASPPAAQPASRKSQDVDTATPPADNNTARDETAPVLKPALQFGKEEAGPQKSPDGDGTEHPSASPAVKPMDEFPQPATAETQQPAPADTPKVPAFAKLQEARTLFSRAPTNYPMATIEIADTSRADRAARLCTTELRAQLLHVSPAYSPELLPSYRLEEGTVSEIPKTAFRSNGQWYDLSYRCEIDSEATKITSFTFHVGDPVPRSEWKHRGLPSQ